MGELVPTAGSGQMFDRIAHRYDLLNRIMSLGLDRAWRRRLVASVGPSEPRRILDLATGTADVALSVAGAYPEAEVVGLDPSEGMLGVGREKISRRALDERVSLIAGDAQALPFEDDSFDAITMAFGIRNVPDRGRALHEMARVVRPHGRVAILELSEPRGGLMAPFARFHVHHVVPRLGGWLSGVREYRYLQESIAAFPSPEAFTTMMGAAGLAEVTAKRLGFGSAQLFVGEPRVTSSE